MKNLYIFLLIAALALFAAFFFNSKYSDDDLPKENMCGETIFFEKYVHKNINNKHKLLNIAKRRVLDCRTAIVYPLLYNGPGKEDDPCGYAMTFLASETEGYSYWLENAHKSEIAKQEIEETFKYYDYSLFCTPKEETHKRLIAPALQLLNLRLKELS